MNMHKEVFTVFVFHVQTDDRSIFGSLPLRRGCSTIQMHVKFWFILKLHKPVDCCDLGVTNYMPEYKSKKRKRRDLPNTTVITGFDSSSSES